MRYAVVDDEMRACNLLKILLTKCAQFQTGDSIASFTDSVEALHFFKYHPIDILFLDIEMPQLNGMEFYKQLKLLYQKSDIIMPEIIFVTAYPEYALKAWDIGAFGYIVKPYERKQIEAVLERYIKYHPVSEKVNIQSGTQKKVYIRCFPDFELLIDGKPVEFKSKKAKELLALLVHNQGNWVTIDKITFCLLENELEESAKNYSRTILYRLRQTLEKAGIVPLVESAYGKCRINTEYVTCDYYEYLSGNTELFKGEYMGEYPWANTARASMWQDMLHPEKDYDDTSIQPKHSV